MEEEKKRKTSIKIPVYLFLHITLFIYSIVGLFSKSAAQHSFLSKDYIMFYMCVLLVMGVYAIMWQQVIKRLPLSIAYGNKAVIVIWGVMWGCLFWKETITLSQILGIILIVVGIIFVGGENGRESE